MVTFKEFIESPTKAVANGYEAWYIDYCAFICSVISIKAVSILCGKWVELFTSHYISELPVAFFKVLFSTALFLTIPLTFPFVALWLYLTRKKAAKAYIEHQELVSKRR